MTSVRAAVNPLHLALIQAFPLRSFGPPDVIFLEGSFVGLPLVNQALARINPQGGGFIVTVRGLIKVLGEIPPADVVAAVAVILKPQDPPPQKDGQQQPPQHGQQPPQRDGQQQPPQAGQPATCGVDVDLSAPGGLVGLRIYGGGFSPGEPVDVIQDDQLATQRRSRAGPSRSG